MKNSGPPQRRTPLTPGSKPLRANPERARQRADERRERVIAEARSGKVPPKKRVKEKPEAGSADREPAKKAAPRRTGPNSVTCRLVDERDDMKCVRCSKPSSNRHHREGRGAGGRGREDAKRTNGAAWLLHLCGQGNTSGCHGWVDSERAESERQGYVIRRNGPPVDAEKVPVLTFNGWFLYLNDGTRVPTEAPQSERPAA